jgi:DNA-binding beta-propeller fold protein YncE
MHHFPVGIREMGLGQIPKGTPTPSKRDSRRLPPREHGLGGRPPRERGSAGSPTQTGMDLSARKLLQAAPKAYRTWVLVWCLVALSGALPAARAQCPPGYTGPDGDCNACPAGTYKTGTGTAACVACGVGGTTAAPASTAEASCSCAPGHHGPYRREAAGPLWTPTSLAGSDARGVMDGVGAQAKFSKPRGVAFSPDAAFMAVATEGGVGVDSDTVSYSSAIRIINMSSRNVTTLAGGQATGLDDGVGTNATFNNPASIAFSPDGAHLVVADEDNHCIRLIHVPSQNVSTLAGTGSATEEGAVSDGVAGWPGRVEPSFYNPRGVAWSPRGGLIAVADYISHRVRLIVLNGNVTVMTLAGAAGVRGYVDGTGTNARFTYPTSVSFSPDGKSIAVTERQSQTGGARGDALRLIDVDSGITSTLAGGTGQDGVFEYPVAAAFSPDGAEIAIAEYSRTQRVQRFRLATGEITEIMVGTTTGIIKAGGLAWSPRDAKLAISTSTKNTIWLLDGPGCSRCKIGEYKGSFGEANCTECIEGKYHDLATGES